MKKRLSRIAEAVGVVCVLLMFSAAESIANLILR